MFRLLSIAPLVMSAIVSAQTGDTLASAVELEFRTIFREFAYKRGLRCQYDHRLDTIAGVQLEFLCRPENPYITHRHADADKESPSDRYRSVYKDPMGVGEILVQLGFFHFESATALAKRALKAWYDSPGHRRIMTGREYTAYSFRFAMNHYGRLVGIGVFIEE